MSKLSAQFDAITASDLRKQGSLKWTEFPDAIGAFVAEMDFGTAEPITSALQNAVANYQYGYLPKNLVTSLQQAYLEFAKRNYDWALQPDQIRIIPDVLSGISGVAQHLIPQDAVIILPTPTYMPFLTLFTELGRHVIQVPMQRDAAGRYTDDLARLAEVLKDHVGSAWLILVNPHNPTGRVRTRDELTDLAELVNQYGGRVISDEIHAPLAYAGNPHIPYATISPAAKSHSVTLTSASKAWNLAGLKAALLILTNDEDLKLWKQRGAWLEHQTATLGVIASATAYTQGEDWLTEVTSYLADNRELLISYLANSLPQVKWYPPEGTYLAWLDFRGIDAKTNWTKFLLEKARVATTDGEQCGAPGFVRLNFAMPRPLLETALEQIAAALATKAQTS